MLRALCHVNASISSSVGRMLEVLFLYGALPKPVRSTPHADTLAISVGYLYVKQEYASSDEER